MDKSPKAMLHTLEVDKNNAPWCEWLTKALIIAVYGNDGDLSNQRSPLRRVSSFRFPSSASCPSCNGISRKRSRSTIRGPLGDSLSRDFTEL
mmetsp:Transcript_1271/g.1611  ORF Transcript_1271/g.1611 Transcript_1271/m.1611 type:complete len:92 (+) Transcript_1271:34-309(+)